jgi:peptidoglycan/LPS O-acetylase OafA/YrhL
VPQIHALTAVRGIAAWWVVFYHFRELFPAGTPALFQQVAAQGYLAVDLFFILSGFVIALNYQNKVTDLRRETVLPFLGARLARIYPLHLVMMLAYLVNPLAIHLFSTAGLAPGQYEPGYYLLSLLLVQNWGFTSDLAWNVPAWSISTEWFCYLLFPPIFVLLLRRLRGAYGLLACMALLLTLLAAVMRDGLGAHITTLGIWRCVIEFHLGVLLCLLRGLFPARLGDRSLLATAAALLLASLWAFGVAPDQLVVPVALMALIWALTNPGSLVSRVVDRSWLRFVGEISYSTYLVHFFVKDWTKFLVVRPGAPDALPLLIYVVAVLAASVLLYRFVEKPGQRLLRGWISRMAPTRVTSA